MRGVGKEELQHGQGISCNDQNAIGCPPYGDQLDKDWGFITQLLVEDVADGLRPGLLPSTNSRLPRSTNEILGGWPGPSNCRVGMLVGFRIGLGIHCFGGPLGSFTGGG